MSRLPQSSSSKTTTVLSVLACVLAGPAVLAQVTAGSPVTADSQLVFDLSGTGGHNAPGFSGPRGVAVSPVDGTIYVADQTEGYVVMIQPTNGGDVSPNGSYLTATATQLAPTGTGVNTLRTPVAVAVDSTGALYIADEYTTAGGTHEGQVIKMANPEGSNAASAVGYITATTKEPVALAVDRTGNVNTLYIADDNQHKIYQVASTGGAGTALTLSSALATPVPVGLAVDGSHNLYYADANTYTNGGDRVYEYSSGTNTPYLAIATTNTAYTLKFSSATKLPIGMGFDPAGNLYVMDSGAATEHLFEVPIANDFYLVPFSNVAPTGIALDSVGNIVLADDTNNKVDKLFYNNPVNFGSVDGGTETQKVTVNVQFNTTETKVAAYQVVQGDYTGEFTTSGTTGCTGTNDGNAGSTCSFQFYADYLTTTPGLRMGAVGFTGTNGITNNTDTLAVLVNGIDLAPSLVLYPGVQSTLSQTKQALYEPQGLAVSGNGKALFVADEGIDYTTLTYPHAAVWEYPVSSGVISSTPTQIAQGTGTPGSPGSFTTPLAVALDAEGNLYVGDYDGTVYVVQAAFNSTTHATTWPGSAKPLTLTGVTLNYPMALTFDPSGDLFIGDMGSANVNATADTPGFIVEVPAGPLACGATSCTIDGPSAFKLPTTTGIIFPQSLVTDTTGNLFIADGGDGVTNLGDVYVLPAADLSSTATGTPTSLSFGSLDEPTGLNFDAANDLYVLNSYDQSVLVAHILETGSVPSVDGTAAAWGKGVSGLTSALGTPSSLVVWPGGQNVTIADVGYQLANGTTPVSIYTVYGADATANVSAGSVTVYSMNAGNENIDFTGPTANKNGSGYSLTGCVGDRDTLEFDVTNTCAITVSNSGKGSGGSVIFTLNPMPNTITVSNTNPAVTLDTPASNHGKGGTPSYGGFQSNGLNSGRFGNFAQQDHRSNQKF